MCLLNFVSIDLQPISVELRILRFIGLKAFSFVYKRIICYKQIAVVKFSKCLLIIQF